MSRIGKKPISIPQNVTVKIDNNIVTVSGNYGSLTHSFSNLVSFLINEKELNIFRINDEKYTKSYHGLTRALIQNMVEGVSKQFIKILIAEGVGYKFQIEKNNLILNMGYTHPINFSIPEDIKIKLESPTKIKLEGISKENIGLFASKIRSIRPPEPYKGKGIRYEGEVIIRKAGKAGK